MKVSSDKEIKCLEHYENWKIYKTISFNILLVIVRGYMSCGSKLSAVFKCKQSRSRKKRKKKL